MVFTVYTLTHCSSYTSYVATHCVTNGLSIDRSNQITNGWTYIEHTITYNISNH